MLLRHLIVPMINVRHPKTAFMIRKTSLHVEYNPSHPNNHLHGFPKQRSWGTVLRLHSLFTMTNSSTMTAHLAGGCSASKLATLFPECDWWSLSGSNR